MDPDLLEIIACPVCKGPVEYNATNQELVCRPDRLAFPIREGVPVMLEDEARSVPGGEIT